jgi:hypothetical protein
MTRTKKTFYLKTTVVLGALFGLFVVVTSFDQKQHNNYQFDQVKVDSPPAKISIDLSNSIKELENAFSKIGDELKKIDWNKISLDIETSVNKINFDKIANDINKAIKEIDVKDIANKMKSDMKKTDWDNFSVEMDKAMEEFKKIDWNKMKKDLGDIKIEFNDSKKEELKKSIEKIKPELKEKMEELKKEIEKIKKESKSPKSSYATLDVDFEKAMDIVSPTI